MLELRHHLDASRARVPKRQLRQRQHQPATASHIHGEHGTAGRRMRLQRVRRAVLCEWK